MSGSEGLMEEVTFTQNLKDTDQSRVFQAEEL